ncbi:virulence associated lipoprotein [Borreliella lusitaniae]|uniref:virulence associated lipoprotein n=1 Tax=Borreliella lusitaniae TaxID=100177 RepID=UPI003C79152D
MKYNILVYIFVFLFLNACNTDFNTNKKDVESPPSSTKESKPSTKLDPNQEKDLNKKNILLNDLRNLIELANEHKEKYIKKMSEEPSDQYGLPFDRLGWGAGTENISSNTERSKRFRRHTYTVLSTINTDELKELSNILKGVKELHIFNHFSTLGGVLDIVTDHLYPKKDALDKLDTSDLEKLKNNLEKILSTITTVSEMIKKLTLDYKNNENPIKTDNTELESHINTLYNQIQEKAIEAEKLRDEIKSIDKF